MEKQRSTIETSPDHPLKPPWHLWVVGTFFFLLYAIGAYDYIMTLGENAAYFRSQGYGESEIAYFMDYPLLPAVFWTLGVWSALATSILLLLRTRWATPVAVIAVASQACLDLVTFGFMNRWQVFGPRQSLFDIAILLLTSLLFLYCRAMTSRNVLR